MWGIIMAQIAAAEAAYRSSRESDVASIYTGRFDPAANFDMELARMRQRNNSAPAAYERDMGDIYTQKRPEQAYGLRGLAMGLSAEQLGMFRELLRKHGKDATYAMPPTKAEIGAGRVRLRTMKFDIMTVEECRAVMDMMLSKRTRDTEAAALKAEQEAIADRTYRNPESDTYDPWRVNEEKRAKEAK